MSTPVPAEPSLGRARRVGIVVIALAIAALFGLPGIPSLVTAWSFGPRQGAHIHLLAQGTHGLIIVVAALTLLQDRWRKPAAVHLLRVSVLFAAAIATAIGLLQGTAVAASPSGCSSVSSLTPGRRVLLTLRPNVPLLAIETVAAGALVLAALDGIRLQATLPAHEPHAAVHH
jgi:hypothetical protein